MNSDAGFCGYKQEVVFYQLQDVFLWYYQLKIE